MGAQSRTGVGVYLFGRVRGFGGTTLKLLGAWGLGMMSGLHVIVALHVNDFWPAQPVEHSTIQTIVWAFIEGAYLMLSIDLFVQFVRETR